MIDNIDPALPVSEIRTMDEILDSQFTSREFNTAIIGIFAALALIMATTGIYGVLSYHVTRRTHEFGIRLALGAQKRKILSNVMLNQE